MHLPSLIDVVGLAALLLFDTCAKFVSLILGFLNVFPLAILFLPLEAAVDIVSRNLVRLSNSTSKLSMSLRSLFCMKLHKPFTARIIIR